MTGATPAAMTDATTTASMRVASYNLHDFKDDPALAADVLRAIAPDVLCLQEVPRRLFSTFRVAAFAERCGLYWSGPHRGSGGTTILTSLRVQVLAASHHRLPVPAFQRRRGYAVSTVALPGHRPLTVVSVHLSLDAAERERHAGAVLDAMAGREPVVLAGDLNEEEQGRASRLLAGRLARVSGDSPTYPSWQPQHALDVIFASTAVTVRPPTGADLDPDDLAAASDHRPVWVDVQMP